MIRSLPAGFNVQHNEILYTKIKGSTWGPATPYLRIVVPKPFVPEVMEQQAKELWATQYYMSVAASDLDAVRAQVMPAHLLPNSLMYDGTTQLTDLERQTICNAGRHDFTVLVSYVMIEGFGWRPGQLHTSGRWPEHKELFAAWMALSDAAGTAQLIFKVAVSMYATQPDGSLSADDEDHIEGLLDVLAQCERLTHLGYDVTGEYERILHELNTQPRPDRISAYGFEALCIDLYNSPEAALAAYPHNARPDISIAAGTWREEPVDTEEHAMAGYGPDGRSVFVYAPLLSCYTNSSCDEANNLQKWLAQFDEVSEREAQARPSGSPATPSIKRPNLHPIPPRKPTEAQEYAAHEEGRRQGLLHFKQNRQTGESFCNPWCQADNVLDDIRATAWQDAMDGLDVRTVRP